jgi:hypothetical protein
VAADLERAFTYHPPVGSQPERYEDIRRKGYELAALISDHVLDSDEKTLAIACVRQAVMWANAGIACNEVVT